MRYIGYCKLSHDAAISAIDENGDILWADEGERYNREKHTCDLNAELMDRIKPDDHVTYFENPELRMENLRLMGQSERHRELTRQQYEEALSYDECHDHHVSHAAGGFYTRPWESVDDTVILTLDGYGEFQSGTIHTGSFELKKEILRPKSIGLIYSFFTTNLGMNLVPSSDEYVTMGLSAYGEPDLVVVEQLKDLYYAVEDNQFRWHDTVKAIAKYLNHNAADMAATVQKFAEDMIMEVAREARKYGSKLVYSGGVAQNIVANTLIAESGLFEDIWIPPACYDAGSSLGAAAHSWAKATGKNRVNWKDAYLGYNIEREINPREVVDHLLTHRYCGVANGRAEFGPRALGNRSLIADVRYDVKNTVNAIKRRQQFRPFAPAILEEFADEYFEGPMNEYMQYSATALHDHQSVIHFDGTSRVQIVRKDCTSVFRKIIEEYYERTGVPMLLNTSLNIRGQPMVNNEEHAAEFERKYGVKVF